jgi:mannobiose 2-epimerase
MAEAVLTEGRDDQGAVVNEGIDGRVTDANKDWWPQAEGLVGFANAYRLSGDLRYLEALERLWDFVERAFIDRDGGEWFGKTDAAGHPRRDLPQVSFWKCPYHNFRAMAELTRRLGE